MTSVAMSFIWAAGPSTKSTDKQRQMDRRVVYLAERCQSAGGNCQLAFAILPARRAGQIWQTYKRLMAIFGMVWREAPVMRANIRRL